MLKTILSIALIFLLFNTSGFSQNSDHGKHDHDAMMAENAVKEVLMAYKNALENLDVSNTQHLFSDDATVFENGKYEGTYQDYLDHHIGPELGHFEEFSFNNYTVTIRLENDIAIAHETYVYKIVLGGEDSRIVERQAVATSVLKNFDGTWRIIQNHGSSRATSN